MRLIAYIIIFIILIFSYLYIPVRVDYDFILMQLILALIILLLRYTDKKKTVSVLIKHSNVFVVSYVVVFYQLFVDLLLGFSDVSNSRLWIDPRVPCYSILYANFGLLSFQLGYYLYGLKHRREYIAARHTDQPNKQIDSMITLNDNNFQIIHSLLQILAVFFLVGYLIFVDKNYLFGGYGFEKDPGVTANYMSMFFSSVMLTQMAYKSLVYRGYIKDLKHYLVHFRPELFLYGCYIFLILLSGARHAAINCIFLLFICFVYVSQKKIKVMLLLPFLVIGSFLLTAMAYVRSGDTNILTQISGISSISPITSELAGSLRTLNLAVYYVPRFIPFNMGLTLFGFLFLVIPGGRAFVLNLFSVPSYLWDSSNFITYLAFGDDATYGVGSSCIADIYVSFGVPGIIVFFLLFGYLIHKVEYNTFVKSSKSLYFMVVTILFYSQMYFITRESLFTLLFGISYPLLIVLMINLFNMRIYENRNSI